MLQLAQFDLGTGRNTWFSSQNHGFPVPTGKSRNLVVTS